MDLGTVRQKLLSGEYRAPVEFISDVELIFTNAKSYNAKGSEVSLKILLNAQIVCQTAMFRSVKCMNIFLVVPNKFLCNCELCVLDLFFD